MRRLTTLAAVVALAVGLGAGHTLAADWVVNDDAKGNALEPSPCYFAPDETTIQDGIDAAGEGDTVTVCPGTYTEDLTIFTYGLELAGVDSATTVIEGATVHGLASGFPSCDGPPIDLQANGASIHDFTIRTPVSSASERTCGLILDGTDIEIFNNNFEVGMGAFVSVAIQTWGAGSKALGDISGLHIHDNTFTNLPSLNGSSFIGVLINTQSNDEDPDNDVLIEFNELSGEMFFGIVVKRGNTEVADNQVDGAFVGVMLDGPGGEEGGANSVHDNSIGQSDYFGILITNNNNEVFRNSTHHSGEDGIEVSGGGNAFVGNNSHHNTECAYDDNGANNTFSTSGPDRNKAKKNGDNSIPC